MFCAPPLLHVRVPVAVVAAVLCPVINVHCGFVQINKAWCRTLLVERGFLELAMLESELTRAAEEQTQNTTAYHHRHNHQQQRLQEEQQHREQFHEHSQLPGIPFFSDQTGMSQSDQHAAQAGERGAERYLKEARDAHETSSERLALREQAVESTEAVVRRLHLDNLTGRAATALLSEIIDSEIAMLLTAVFDEAQFDIAKNHSAVRIQAQSRMSMEKAKFEHRLKSHRRAANFIQSRTRALLARVRYRMRQTNAMDARATIMQQIPEDMQQVGKSSLEILQVGLDLGIDMDDMQWKASVQAGMHATPGQGFNFNRRTQHHDHNDHNDHGEMLRASFHLEDQQQQGVMKKTDQHRKQLLRKLFDVFAEEHHHQHHHQQQHTDMEEEQQDGQSAVGPQPSRRAVLGVSLTSAAGFLDETGVLLGYDRGLGQRVMNELQEVWQLRTPESANTRIVSWRDISAGLNATGAASTTTQHASPVSEHSPAIPGQLERWMVKQSPALRESCHKERALRVDQLESGGRRMWHVLAAGVHDSWRKLSLEEARSLWQRDCGDFSFDAMRKQPKTSTEGGVVQWGVSKLQEAMIDVGIDVAQVLNILHVCSANQGSATVLCAVEDEFDRLVDRHHQEISAKGNGGTAPRFGVQKLRKEISDEMQGLDQQLAFFLLDHARACVNAAKLLADEQPSTHFDSGLAQRRALLTSVLAQTVLPAESLRRAIPILLGAATAVEKASLLQTIIASWVGDQDEATAVAILEGCLNSAGGVSADAPALLIELGSLAALSPTVATHTKPYPPARSGSANQEFHQGRPQRLSNSNGNSALDRLLYLCVGRYAIRILRLVVRIASKSARASSILGAALCRCGHITAIDVTSSSGINVLAPESTEADIPVEVEAELEKKGAVAAAARSELHLFALILTDARAVPCGLEELTRASFSRSVVHGCTEFWWAFKFHTCSTSIMIEGHRALMREAAAVNIQCLYRGLTSVRTKPQGDAATNLEHTTETEADTARH
jgi:hypothetical protein